MSLTKPDEGSDQLDNFATHVRILSWFFDDPSPLCPFSVHRMALIGKELGKEVGEWFGPSTAAGALKSVHSNLEPNWSSLTDISGHWQTRSHRAGFRWCLRLIV